MYREIKIIFRLGQHRPIATKTTAPTTQLSEYMPSTIFMKAPTAKSPQIQTEVTHQQSTDIAQTSLVNTVTNFFDLNETKLLETNCQQKLQSNCTLITLQLTSPI